jgi:REP-associated tyrosine transposase
VGQTFRRKRNRLSLDVYQGSSAYSTTTTVKGRRPVFGHADIVAMCIEKLREAAARTGFEVVAYCFMPDHLHLLVRSPERADLVAFMRLFKQLSGYAYRQLTGDSEVLWQTSYYDHVLRQEEDLHNAARYIWGNPVRASLVESATEYPYSGSLTMGIEWTVE